MLPHEVGLDWVVFKPDVLTEWAESNSIIISKLVEHGLLTNPEQVGEKHGVWNEDTGFMTIVCNLGPYIATLAVPPGKWCWKN